MFTQRCRNKIIRYIKTTYTRIELNDFEMGQGIWNHKCHLNSVQFWHENPKEIDVILCFCIEESNDNNTFVHFINRYKGKYIDHTLGWLTNYNHYYFIRKINPNEFEEIGDILTQTKYSLFNLATNSLDRLLFFGNVNNLL